MSGVEPWTGSNNPFSSPILPDGARPNPPTKPALSSDNISPNKYLNCIVLKENEIKAYLNDLDFAKYKLKNNANNVILST